GQRNMELVDEAVDLLRGRLDAGDLSLTPEQVEQTLRKEKGAPAFPTHENPGPDYDDIFPNEPCQCPQCCGERGEDPFEDFDDEEMLEDLPPDIPPEIGRMLLEETKRAVLNGESPEKVLARAI